MGGKYAQLEFCFVLLCVREHEAAVYSRTQSTVCYQALFFALSAPIFQCSDFLLIIPRRYSASDSDGTVTPRCQGRIAAQTR